MALQTRINKTFNQKNSLNGSLGYQRTSNENPNFFHFTDAEPHSGHQPEPELAAHFQPDPFRHRDGELQPPVDSRYPVLRQPGQRLGRGRDHRQQSGPGELWAAHPVLLHRLCRLNTAQANLIRNQTTAVGYQMMWLKRPHNITLGGDIRRIQLNFSDSRTRAAPSASPAPPRRALRTESAPPSRATISPTSCSAFPTPAIAFGNADKYFRSLLRRARHRRLARQLRSHAERRRALGIRRARSPRSTAAW